MSVRACDPDNLPGKTAELLKWLDEQYPHRCPALGQNPDEVQRYAGKRELIDSLLCRAYGPDRKDWNL